MKRSNPLVPIFVVCLLTLGGVWGLAALRAGTRPTLNSTVDTVVAVAPVRNWQVLFNDAATDNAGTNVTNPYALSTWSTIAKDCNTSGGRLLVLSDLKSSDRIELMLLFTTAAAQASYQLWSFDYVDQADVPSANTSGLVPLGGSLTRSLGLPYAQSLDAGLDHFTAAASAFTVKGTVTGNVFYPDQSSGTTYYVGARRVFTASGCYAWLPTVHVISGGTVVVVARVI